MDKCQRGDTGDMEKLGSLTSPKEHKTSSRIRSPTAGNLCNDRYVELKIMMIRKLSERQTIKIEEIEILKMRKSMSGMNENFGREVFNQ